ncbi:MAG: 50S ribosomal protein L11 methyltransferase [Bryobacteraceae bacterium]|nr:50S ribosomal protein L11 methyltransferase [Bryobacteraceae bacterium]
MFRLAVRVDPDEEEEILARASDLKLTGIEQENLDSGELELVFWFAERRDAEAGIAALPEAQWSEAADINWNETFQREWQPAEVGRRWFLVPPGSMAETPAGRVRMEMRPGMAFGSGDHAATHLCLELMEDWVHPGDVLLDVGCGAGILLEAAVHLGADLVFGCDIDWAAAPSFHGSAAAVRTASVDVAVVNIQIGVILELWPEIRRIVRPGGRVIVSGVFSDQVAELPEQPVVVREKSGWAGAVIVS